MIKKILTCTCCLTFTIICKAQFYYKDIISNKQVQADLARLKEQKIRSVKITSLESDGQPSENFLVDKKINKSYTRIEAFSKSGVTGASLFTSYFTKDGQLISTNDSSDLSVNSSFYFYNSDGSISSIRSEIYSSDDDFSSKITEEHIYQYNPGGKLISMHRVKNGTDSTLILFSTDEMNNVTIEKDIKSGKSYYYYYDNKNRLTDVVHLNPYNQKMLPDYMFEYNNAGQISKMTSTEEGSSDYYVWKYSYDDGLRSTEKCYSKDRKLLGTIEYAYK
ncbi:MAG: hypothetical protein KF825_14485 [Ferruginibacter sp.]|nr:hypothetical protein [Ferruginibacter sp.]